MKKRNCYFLMSLVITLVSGCQSTSQPIKTSSKVVSDVHVAREDVNKLFVVDCLLPSQVRKLGGQFTYLAPRRPIKTTAINCEIRGGEYTAYDRADYRTSLKVWLAAAKEGNADAQVNVGEIYEKGLGIIPDYELARLWYEKSARQGNARAEINLGYLYEKGLGVEKDLVQAINWYRKASGLVNDDLKFASSIEVEVAVSTKKEVVKLKQDVANSRQEAKSLRKQLSRTANNLTVRKKQLKGAFSRLKQLQAQTSQYFVNGKKQNQKLVSLEKEIALLQRDIGYQKKTIASLQTDLGKQKNKLSEKVLLASAKVDNRLTKLAGPSINIIGKPLVLTRGLPTLYLPATSRGYDLSGMVNAPAGLLGFTVNGRKHETQKNGRFAVNVSAKDGHAKVKMVAVDKGGRVARLLFAVEKQINPAPGMVKAVANQPFPAEAAKSIAFGNYYALVIGNNSYKNFPTLKSAVNDATKAASLLKDKYGFKTKLILNADRYSILSAMNEMRAKLTKKDNLLIYYAGHGEVNNVNQRGYWLPVDAETESTANWISNLDITDMLNVIDAKHILVVADSCYSGTMSRTAQTRMDLGLNDVKQREKWIKVMSKTRARIVMTSGGVKPVLDEGSNGHSVFASAFLDALENNKSVIEGYQLYKQITQTVQNNAARYSVEQIPRYAPIKHGGGLGEFFFVPAKL